jgi:translation initiation factor IF-2
MAEVEIGKVTHYFGKIHVAAIEITRDRLQVGDTIHVVGHTSDFTQRVESMQVDNQPVETATPGQSVGIEVVDHAREHDLVYRVLEQLE